MTGPYSNTTWFYITFNASVGGICSGTLTNEANVTVKGVSSGDYAYDNDTANVTAIALNPSIMVTKQANVTTATIGDTINYTYTVTNNGDVTLTTVQVTDNNITGSITLNATTLAPGEWAIGYLEHIVTESDLPGPINNTANASGQDPLTNMVYDEAKESVTLTYGASIMVTKQANVTTATIGDT
ncbi:MAG: DUF7507 domain-containing protein, partial [Thermoplasmatota archaeon]